MRISSKSNQGSSFLTALIAGGILSLTLASYLTLVQSQSRGAMRSLAWNSAIPVAEAGVEEALTQISVNGTNLVANNGWVLTNGKYFMKTRLIDGNPCVVGISDTRPPIIVAQGKTTASGTTNLISRTIKVRTQLNGLFASGMVAKLAVNLNGNFINVDSYDSSNPDYSTDGRYDPAKRRDHAKVATNSGDPKMLSAGNANIWGKLSTGPGGMANTNANCSIGDKSWHAAGKKGIQPGAIEDDMNFGFLDITCPFGPGGLFPPDKLTVNGTNYDFVLDSKRYVISDGKGFGGKVLVRGNAQLLVTSDIQFSGSDYLYIAPNASLELYVSAPKATLGGQGVQNDTGRAVNFIYYGLPTNTSLSYSGNAGVACGIYAPNADFTMGGGGSTVYDFSGACVTRSITMNGHFNFHYDERLAIDGPNLGYIATSWDEIRQGWDQILTSNADLDYLN